MLLQNNCFLKPILCQSKVLKYNLIIIKKIRYGNFQYYMAEIIREVSNISKEGAFLVDVRSPDEFAEGNVRFNKHSFRPNCCKLG
jgi:hypothetical protein